MPVLRDCHAPGSLSWSFVECDLDEHGRVVARRDADGCLIMGFVIPTASFLREGNYFVEITPGRS